jgi:pterin-4a-carbinolamine dehydratase
MHESYFQDTESVLPVRYSKNEPPIQPSFKWEKFSLDGATCLKKIFVLNNIQNRNYMINELLDYEQQVGHNAVIHINGNKITLLVYTKGINSITDIDHEYAKFADMLHKDSMMFYICAHDE